MATGTAALADVAKIALGTQQGKSFLWDGSLAARNINTPNITCGRGAPTSTVTTGARKGDFYFSVDGIAATAVYTFDGTAWAAAGGGVTDVWSNLGDGVTATHFYSGPFTGQVQVHNNQLIAGTVQMVNQIGGSFNGVYSVAIPATIGNDVGFQRTFMDLFIVYYLYTDSVNLVDDMSLFFNTRDLVNLNYQGTSHYYEGANAPVGAETLSATAFSKLYVPGTGASAAGATSMGHIYIQNRDRAGPKAVRCDYVTYKQAAFNTAGGIRSGRMAGFWNSSATITSVNFTTSAANLSGQVQVWGFGG